MASKYALLQESQRIKNTGAFHWEFAGTFNTAHIMFSALIGRMPDQPFEAASTFVRWTVPLGWRGGA